MAKQTGILTNATTGDTLHVETEDSKWEKYGGYFKIKGDSYGYRRFEEEWTFTLDKPGIIELFDKLPIGAVFNTIASADPEVYFVKITDNEVVFVGAWGSEAHDKGYLKDMGMGTAIYVRESLKNLPDYISPGTWAKDLD